MPSFTFKPYQFDGVQPSLIVKPIEPSAYVLRPGRSLSIRVRSPLHMHPASSILVAVFRNMHIQTPAIDPDTCSEVLSALIAWQLFITTPLSSAVALESLPEGPYSV